MTDNCTAFNGIQQSLCTASQSSSLLVHLQGAHGTVSRLVEKHVGRPLPEIRKSGGLLQDSLDMIRSQVAIITPTEPLSASQDHILNLVRIAAKRYASVQGSRGIWDLVREKARVFQCLAHRLLITDQAQPSCKTRDSAERDLQECTKTP